MEIKILQQDRLMDSAVVVQVLALDSWSFSEKYLEAIYDLNFSKYLVEDRELSFK